MPQKVLIVDDDQPTRSGLAMLMMDAGYETITASTVPAAIKMLTDEQPDLLIVDIRLDQYNGARVAAVRRGADSRCRADWLRRSGDRSRRAAARRGVSAEADRAS